METNFNFKSQVCTTREQSERLLALGLKEETADMCHASAIAGELIEYYGPIVLSTRVNATKWDIPAWSLSRLIEMMPFRVGRYNHLGVIVNKENIEIIDLEEGTVDIAWEKENVYDNIHDCIEWLIKEGYFNKEYLV